MGFLSLLQVASMPVLEVLIVSVLGAFLASQYCNLLTGDLRRSLNKLVFMVFTPSLMFASLAKTVTLDDIISWWFMPINVGFTFLIGGILGWILVKFLKPKPYLEGLIIAACSSGNMGNLPLIIVPAICDEDGSPFGGRSACRLIGISYASFSMALGGFYIWTYTYQLIRASSQKFEAQEKAEYATKEPNKDLDANQETYILNGGSSIHVPLILSETKNIEDAESQTIAPQDSASMLKQGEWLRKKFIGIVHTIIEELMAPPTISAILGFMFGAISWLRNLIIGDNAPLHIIEDTVKLLGDATIPCITLILGGNLTSGMRSSKLKTSALIGIVIIRFIISPTIGMGIVKLAGNLGYLAHDPLYHYVLMIQYALPPAMNIGTMTQLFNVGQDECSVIFLWTYLVAALAITVWSTVFLWILS